MIAWLMLTTVAWSGEPWTDAVDATPPGLARQVDDARPGLARNGDPVFLGSVPSGAGPAIMARLVRQQDPLETRVALVRWLRRSDSGIAPWIRSWLPRERAPEVRVAMVHALRRLQGVAADAALRDALDDRDAAVRAAAAVVAGYSDSAELVPRLISATRDADTEVASLAARSLGWMGAAQGFDPIVQLLAVPDEDVRLRAVRALERLDSSRAAQLPALRALATDPSPRLSRAVRGLTTP